MKKFAGFVVAGGVATILNYSLFLLTLGLEWQPLIASSVGYLSGISVSYVLNLKLNFKSAMHSGLGFAKYTATYMIALPLQLVLLSILMSLGVAVVIANGVAILIILVLNFLVIRRFVFLGA